MKGNNMSTSDEWIREIEERRARRKVTFDAITKPLFDELHARGYQGDTICEIERNSGVNQDTLELLLNSIRDIDDEGVRVQLLLAIGRGRRKLKYDGSFLTTIYDSEHSSGFLRTMIANVVWQNTVAGVAEWAVTTILNRNAGHERAILCFALDYLLPREEANRLLMEIFVEMPDCAAPMLAKLGGEKERAFMERNLFGLRKDHQRLAVKAMNRINRRLQREEAKRQKLVDASKRKRSTIPSSSKGV